MHLTRSSACCRWALLLAGIVAIATAAHADSLVPLNGGPFAGLRLLVPNRPGEYSIGRYVPGYEKPSPPSADHAATIHALLKSFYANDQVGFGAQIVSGATYNGGELDWHGKNGVSPDVPLTIQVLTPLATVCVDADYWKIDEDEARISWICGGQLSYVSFVRFEGSKVRSFRTEGLPALTLGEPTK